MSAESWPMYSPTSLQLALACENSTRGAQRVLGDVRLFTTEFLYELRYLLNGQGLLNAAGEVIVRPLLCEQAGDARNDDPLSLRADTRTSGDIRRQRHRGRNTGICCQQRGQHIYATGNLAIQLVFLSRTIWRRGRGTGRENRRLGAMRSPTSHTPRIHFMIVNEGGKASRMSSVPPGRSTRIWIDVACACENVNPCGNVVKIRHLR